MSQLRDIIAAIDKFERDLGFAAPEVIPDHIERLRNHVRGIFEFYGPDLDEDEDDEDEPAKVIVVTTDAGREIRYAAPDFGILHDGTLIIGTRIADGIDGVTGAGIDKLTVAAAYAPGRWAVVRKDAALARNPEAIEDALLATID